MLYVSALELWDREMRRCVVKVPPLFNDALIFRTDEISYHGFPDPLRYPRANRARAWPCITTPPSRARKSQISIVARTIW